MDQATSVMLVDDHPLVLSGLKRILGQQPGLNVVWEGGSGEEAVQKARELTPQIVFMDIRLPGIDGIEATKQIKEASPRTTVIILTVYDDDTHLVDALRAGAAGYLIKTATESLILHTLQTVVEGGTVVNERLLRDALQGVRSTTRDRQMGLAAVERLSEREMEALRLLIDGHGNKEIAAQMHLAESTVKKHVQSIIQKLRASDRTHAAVRAVQMGLV